MTMHAIPPKAIANCAQRVDNSVAHAASMGPIRTDDVIYINKFHFTSKKPRTPGLLLKPETSEVSFTLFFSPAALCRLRVEQRLIQHPRGHLHFFGRRIDVPLRVRPDAVVCVWLSGCWEALNCAGRPSMRSKVGIVVTAIVLAAATGWQYGLDLFKEKSIVATEAYQPL